VTNVNFQFVESKFGGRAMIFNYYTIYKKKTGYF